jgi:hypothetical protein
MKMPKFAVRSNSQDEPIYESTTADHYIEITEGPFIGTHFAFGKVEFLGEDEEGNGNITFDYDLLFIPEHVNLLEDKQRIEEEISSVLQTVLETLVHGEDNETGNTDTEQPTEG